MSDFSILFTKALSLATLIADILIVGLIIMLIFRKPVFLFQQYISYIARHALLASFLISLGALTGSLIYSNVIGFVPCDLCWIQRIFLYPQVVLFGIAYYKKDQKIFDYTLPLSILGGLVALYQVYTQFGGYSFTACTAVGGSCSKVFFNEFGFITIPTMALTMFILLIILAYIGRFRSSLS